MSLDIADTVKSSFGALKESHGIQLVLALIVIQFLIQTPGLFSSAGIVSLVITLPAVLLGLAVAFVFPIGALRVFDSRKFRIGDFGRSAVRPAVKNLGVGTVTGILAYLPALLIVYPMMLAGFFMTGVGISGITGASGASLLNQISGPVIALAGLGVLLALIWIGYVIFSLILAAPYLANSGARLFESMDRSVQSSKGDRFSMFLAIIPLLILQIIIGAGSAILGEGPAAIVYSVVGWGIVGVLGISYINQFYQRLG